MFHSPEGGYFYKKHFDNTGTFCKAEVYSVHRSWGEPFVVEKCWENCTLEFGEDDGSHLVRLVDDNGEAVKKEKEKKKEKKKKKADKKEKNKKKSK